MNPSPAGDDSEPTSDTGVPITAAAVLDPGVLEAEAANGDEEGDASASGEKGRPNSGEKGRPNATTECADTYHVVAGDYWLRFVDSSGATLDEWLTANNAEPDTQMYVGDELCIPDGARAPDPPAAPSTEDESTAPDEQESTTSVEASAADTTAPPATEDAASTTATTAAPAPTTTAAAAPAPPPTTTAAPPAPPPAAPASPTTPAGVEALIREIWPDDIEERALTIARRESSLRPDAYNGWCCYGIFQIYFRANRSFLAQYGVTSAEQLFDARTNVTIAYAMYQASGWDPWSQTDPGP